MADRWLIIIGSQTEIKLDEHQLWANLAAIGWDLFVKFKILCLVVCQLSMVIR